MRRRAFIQTGLGLGLGVPFSVLGIQKFQWQAISFNGLGTTLSIQAAHTDASKLNMALTDACNVVAHVEDLMSLFRPTSAISQLNREGELLHPHEDLLRVLQISQRIAMRSHGAFDITVQPLWVAYAKAQKHGRLPTLLEIQAARRQVGWRHLNISTHRVAFAKRGMGITLNGIAQGYASDRVRETLKRHGVEHALINTGEWSALGLAEGRRDWMLGIASPRQSDRLMAYLHMNGWCVATSADDQCAFSVDRRHHHILNPKTGYSPSDISGVTVAAKSCMWADALTKVIFMGGYDSALRLAQEWQVDVLVVHKDGQWKATPALLRQLVV